MNRTHRFRLVLALFAVVAVTALTACASRAPSWGVSPGDDGRISLSVHNDNFQDARVFSRLNGERRRLGLVPGNSSDTFTLAGRSGSLRLEVDFVAGGGFLSDAIHVNPGDNLVFRIPSRR